ncbi:MAG: SH3 domain-containing protein [Lachnospiraceae bacterium]|nr:SH3 domain-containing protein [Lachnospiraceae bacterium]
MKEKRSSDLRDIILGHYQYILVGILFIILVIVLVVFSMSRKKSSDKKASADASTASSSIGNEKIPVPDAKLEQNAYEEVNSFFTEYYQAVAAGDTDKIEEMGLILDDAEKARIKVKAEFTEDYENMSCYTKPGPEDESLIVFVYYEIKFKSITTLAPGLSTFYLCKNEDGSYYLKDITTLPDNFKEYITTVANGQDVQDLLTEVDTLFGKNEENDPSLAAFMKSLQTRTEAAASSANSGSGSEAQASTDVQVRVTTTDTVNIREKPDQSSNKVGQAAKGDSFVKLSDENGWSKIQYKDGEAYIRSDFLTTAQGETVVAGQVAEDAPAEAEAGGGAAQAETGKIKAKEAVSIRASASTDSQKLGSAYKGDTFDLTGSVDGWYQINYNGTTGYIKSDYCEKI